MQTCCGTWRVFQDECGELVTHVQLPIVTTSFARLGNRLLLGVNLENKNRELCNKYARDSKFVIP